MKYFLLLLSLCLIAGELYSQEPPPYEHLYPGAPVETTGQSPSTKHYRAINRVILSPYGGGGAFEISSSSSERAEVYLDNAIIAPISYNDFNDESILDNHPTSSHTIGSIEGSYSVDLGAAKYTVPLSTPKGVHGLEPSIAISYSGSGNAELGRGWGLAGLSSIYRTNRTQDEDGAPSSPEFTSDDAYSIGGLRLAKWSGTYGQTGCQFMSSDYSSIEVKEHNSDGPVWFEVRRKNGIIAEYGRSYNSKRFNAEGVIYDWKISRIRDTYGNYIDFEYVNNNGHSRISVIRYGGNLSESSNHFNEILFSYSTRSDEREKFIGGQSVKTKYLLTGIRSTVHGAQYSQYTLKYSYESESFLTKLEFEGRNGETVNPTLFTYYDKGEFMEESNVSLSGLSNLQMHKVMTTDDFTNDGLADILIARYEFVDPDNNNHTHRYLEWKLFKNNGQADSYSLLASENIPSGYEFQSGSTYFSNWNASQHSIDFNGDGRRELILAQMHNSDGWILDVLKSIQINDDGTTEEFEIYSDLGPGYLPKWVKPGKFMYVGDFSGNGREDVILFGVGHYANNGNCMSRGSSLNTFDNSVMGWTSYGLGSSMSWVPTAKSVFQTDIDGDGKNEIAAIFGGDCNDWTSFEVFEIDISETDSEDRVDMIYQGGNPSEWYQTVVPADLNGDSKTDLLSKASDGTWSVYYSTGDGFYNAPIGCAIGSTTNTSVRLGDFNGDGLVDLFNYSTSGGGAVLGYFAINKGDLSFELENHSFTYSYLDDIHIADHNGDGRSDIVNMVNVDTPLEIIYFSKNTFHNRLKKCVDGMGKENTFLYHWMTQSSRYDQVGSLETAISFPNNRFTSSIPLVSTLSYSNSNGGNSSIQYFYESAIINRQGRGFLGFEKVVTSNASNNVVEVSKSEEFWSPTALLPSERSVYEYEPIFDEDSGNKLLQVNREYQSAPIVGQAVGIFNWSQNTKDYLSGSEKRRRVFQFDSFSGNDLNVVEEIGPIDYPDGSWIEKVETISTLETIDDWLVNSLPTSITATKSRKNTDGVLYESTHASWVDYNGDGSINYTLDEKGVSTTFTDYDNFGHPRIATTSSLSDAHTVVTNSTYSPDGRFLMTIEDDFGRETQYDYNGVTGQQISEIDFRGLESTASYDGIGNLVEQTDQTGAVRAFTYEWVNVQPGQVNSDVLDMSDVMYSLTTQAPNQSDVYSYFNRVGLERKQVSSNHFGEEIEAATLFDSRGRVVSELITRFSSAMTKEISQKTYNPLTGKLATQVLIDEQGNELTSPTIYIHTPSLNGHTAEVTLPNGTVQSKTYDAAGKVISSTDEGGTLTFKYDEQGNTLTINLNGAEHSTLTYDDYGRKKSLFDLNSGTSSYSYDSFDRLIYQVDAIGNGYEMIYNDLGQLEEKKVYENANLSEQGVFSGTEQGSYSYLYYTEGVPYVGQLASETAPIGDYSTHYTYTDLGQQETVTEIVDGTSYETSFTYDNIGRLLTTTYPSGIEVTNSFHPVSGLLDERALEDGTVIWKALEQNSRGTYTSVQRGLLSTERTFDRLGYPEKLFIDQIQNLELLYHHNSGNLLQRKDLEVDLQENFDYDDLDRLTHYNVTLAGPPWLEGGDCAVRYSDNCATSQISNGNIQFKNDMGDYSYEFPHPTEGNIMPNAVSSVTDPDDMISPEIQAIVYNSFNSISSISEGQSFYEVFYGPDEQRRKSIFSIDGQVSETISYSGSYLKIEVENGDTYDVQYLSGPTGIAAVHVQVNQGIGEIYFPVMDQIGSILGFYDANGNLLSDGLKNYDPWGRARNPESWEYFDTETELVANQNELAWHRRDYTSQENLFSFGIINMNGRCYDPMLGRMLSADNFVGNPHSTQDYNRYTYANNNPLKYTDPDGELAFMAYVGIYAGVQLTADLLRNDFNMNIGEIGISAGKGVLNGSLAYLSGGAETGWVALGSAITGQLPALGLTVGNYSFSVSPSILLGEGFGVGVNTSLSVGVGEYFSISGGFGLSQMESALGSKNFGIEQRLSGGINYNNGDFGWSLYSTTFKGLATDQRVGGASFRKGDWGGRYENDGTPFGLIKAGDDGDSYRSGALQVSYMEFTVGAKIFTGLRGEEEQRIEKEELGGIRGDRIEGNVIYPFGLVVESGPKYRLGAAYIGYQGYQVGFNSQRISHAVQGQFIHGFVKKQRAFEVFDKSLHGYFNYQSYNPFTLW